MYQQSKGAHFLVLRGVEPGWLRDASPGKGGRTSTKNTASQDTAGLEVMLIINGVIVVSPELI